MYYPGCEDGCGCDYFCKQAIHPEQTVATQLIVLFSARLPKGIYGMSALVWSSIARSVEKISTPLKVTKTKMEDIFLRLKLAIHCSRRNSEFYAFEFLKHFQL